MTLSRKLVASLSIVLGVVLFVAINVVAQTWLRNARVDLTQNSLYTLSAGTRATINRIGEPVTLRFFFSRKASTEYAQLIAYADRVRDLLQEYGSSAPGKVIVEEVDPEPFTPAEDQAVAAGLTGIPTQNGETIYFGLSGTNTVDGRETIPFFDISREQYLEYDLSTLIYKLANTKKPKLGIISELPLETGPGGMRASLQGNAQPYAFYSQLREAYDIQMLDKTVDRIPADISTLLVIHPSDMQDPTFYAVDQFVMRGGHLIAFVDPFSESIAAQSNPALGGPPARTSSSLDPLFKSWGVDFDITKIVTDLDRAQRVQAGNQVVDYLVWLGLTQSDFNASDPVTGNLQQINVASAGALSPVKGATTQFTPLMQSSGNAARTDTELVQSMRDPQDLLRRFESQGKFTLAARITGPAKSAYPNGAPSPSPLKPPPTEGAAPSPPPAPLPPPVAEAKNVNIIVVADTDMLDDRFWVHSQAVLGQRVMVPTADNGAFVQNAIENMSGSSDLISLRTRARSSRPFILVDQIRRQAETRFLAEEQRLRSQVTQTEERLRTLQSSGGEGGAKGEVLTKAQQTEVDRFRRQLVSARASLRDVQANLRSDVEALGTRLAFINIALVPLLVAVAALVLAVLRRRRRARARGLQ